MVKTVTCFILLGLVLISCDPVKVNQPAVSEARWDNIRLSHSGPLKTSKVTVVDPFKLEVAPAKGRKMNVTSSAKVRNQLSKFAAGKPFKSKADSTWIAYIIPGTKEFLSPVTYKIATDNVSLQHGDSILPPIRNIAQWPEPTPALPMRFRDAALHDIQFLDVEQGLPSSYIDAIYEDEYGNMWFGSYGGGVTRYDGHTFTTFTVDQGLSDNVVQRILRDSKGNMWFGTDGAGVSKYDGSEFTNYSVEQGFCGIYVETIVEDDKANVWFGTNGGGLTKYSQKKGLETFTNFSTDNGLAGNNVWASLLDHKGHLWFGTRNGLSRYDGNSFKNFTTAHGLVDNDVRSLYQDNSGNLWIGTEAGLSIYDGEQFINYGRSQGLKNSRIWQIKSDHDDNIWLGTDGGGVYKMSFDDYTRLDRAFLTSYTHNEGLSYDFIRSMWCDRDGNMWFGIDGGGVTKFRQNSFTSFTANEHLSANSVWSVFEDSSGGLWFGSDAWGIYRFKDGYYQSFMDDEGLLEYSVMDIVEDKHGHMWFATFGGGVIRYDGTDFFSYNVDENFPHRDVYSMIEGSDGNIWFGTQGSGLVKYDGEFFTTYSTRDGLANDRIWNIYEDSKGNILVGTFGGGLSKFDGQSFTNYTVDEGLLNNSVNSILEDHEGNLWLGTDEGLNKIVLTNPDTSNDGMLYAFTVNDGLVNSIILSLIEDIDHRIWIGTEGGIVSLNQKQNQSDQPEAYKMNAYVQSDGLKGLDVVINSVCLDEQNRLWWGTGKGLTMLQIDDIELNNSAPSLQLNGISIKQEFVDFRSLENKDYRKTLPYGDALHASFDSITPFQNYPKELTLPHYLNHLTFNFSAIDWRAPHRVKYQYMLTGLDENWSNLKNEARAEYRNLDYGDYEFKVRAIGAGAVWSEVFSYPFTIIIPWWHSWWARTLYLIIGLVSLISFDRWRTFRILRNQRELQRSIEERNRELELMVEERTAEIKRQQQKTEEANQVLEQKVKERTKELLEKNKKLSEYAFVNAHNLRVPVANIKGIIQLFENVKSKEEKTELIELLKGQSNSLDNVLIEIKEMLERDNYQTNN